MTEAFRDERRGRGEHEGMQATVGGLTGIKTAQEKEVRTAELEEQHQGRRQTGHGPLAESVLFFSPWNTESDVCVPHWGNQTALQLEAAGWNPEHPKPYPVVLRAEGDEYPGTTVALRTARLWHPFGGCAPGHRIEKASPEGLVQGSYWTLWTGIPFCLHAWEGSGKAKEAAVKAAEVWIQACLVLLHFSLLCLTEVLHCFLQIKGKTLHQQKHCKTSLYCGVLEVWENCKHATTSEKGKVNFKMMGFQLCYFTHFSLPNINTSV